MTPHRLIRTFSETALFLRSRFSLVILLPRFLAGDRRPSPGCAFPFSLLLSFSKDLFCIFFCLMDVEMADQETEELPYPRDFLQRFAGSRCGEESHPSYGNARDTTSQDSGDTELSLGLSLGGCFAVGPRETRLVRSSSTETFSVFGNEREFTVAPAGLVRTCSLPVEAEEEHRKRKEMQSLKRLEAKRKRSEKRNGSRSPSATAVVDKKVEKKDEAGFTKMNGYAPPRFPMGPVGDRSEVEQSRRGTLWRSSSDFDGRSVEGCEGSDLSNSSTISSNPDMLRKSTAAAPLPPLLRSLKSLQEDVQASKKMTESTNQSRDMGTNMMDEMPCVSTKGDGPNGRRIEGFLYKYKKGEEVRIVCVCHGSFLTPAEFVKHAGGGDVTHPLRHIVVIQLLFF
ncbi:hypothetical protein HPP92_000793 [Vanilla planifolia]|uniref:Ninja-family protein n=1 Tax=Vanilla planifolia TaxID=51239 RepID=A0A835RYP8_VANPL|nr:hypothetical protein HPP92_000793 [Vanilla planifolia]